MVKYDNELNGYFENGKFTSMAEKIAEHRGNLVTVKNTLQAIGQGHLVTEDNNGYIKHICDCKEVPIGYVYEPTEYKFIEFIKIIMYYIFFFVIGLIIGRLL